MIIDALMSDDAVLQAIGKRLARRRLELELTQAQLAEQAGVGKRTVERIEAGESAQTATLIRIFRILGLLENFASFIPESGPRPLDLLKLKGKERHRASSKKQQDHDDKPWSWGDEE